MLHKFQVGWKSAEMLQRIFQEGILSFCAIQPLKTLHYKNYFLSPTGALGVKKRGPEERARIEGLKEKRA